MTVAADAAGVARRTVYAKRERDAEFRQAWDDAIESVVEQLEREAYCRAMDGSDRLIMFLLRARRPHVYCERFQVRHSSAFPAQHVSRIRPLQLDAEQRETLARLLRSRPATKEASR